MVAKIHAGLKQARKYGRESTANLTYNGETLLSTEMAGLPADQQEGDFFLTKAGFFLFDDKGALIFGGDSHDE